MKSSPVALCGVSLSLAVALFVVARRAHKLRSSSAEKASSSSLSSTKTTTRKTVDGVTTVTTTTSTVTASSTESSSTTTAAAIPLYFKKNESLETERIASDQEFADGSSVKVHGHGTGKVLHYIPQSKSYKVEIHEHGKTQQKTVPVIHISHVKVKDFFVYPIKSCRGIRLDHAEITAKGIANDRTWMLVDTKGKFITQRRYPKMALIVPKLDDLVHPTGVTLTAEGAPDLFVPIVREDHGAEIVTKVWKSDMLGVDQGDAAAQWFNDYLADVREEREFRLIRIKDSFRRPTNPKFAPDHETVFADGFPFLLALDASVTDINEHLKDKITMDRFRPNIVLTGAPAFADETWDCITIGGLKFRNVRPCERCNMPGIDQDTGVAHPENEPHNTMVPIRNGPSLGFKNAKEATYFFGSNMVADETGTLAVGAPVKVLTLKQAVYA